MTELKQTEIALAEVKQAKACQTDLSKGPSISPTRSPLDALTLPFLGSSLIEASAGTGKTYTITGLYLRLLLGHGELPPLGCEQILVVTFTNAATQELRDRIRKRIQVAFKCFLGVAVEDEFVNALKQAFPGSERQIALKRLDLALKSLDEAAIFTIHGFCQRILADLAFESSLLFESEFTLDDSEFLHHSVRDFWRETCYPLPPYLAEIIAKHFGEPDTLASKLRPLLGPNEAKTLGAIPSFNTLTQGLTTSLSRLKLLWQSEHENTLALLHSLPLNGTRFGKQSDGYPKLGQMFDELSHWAMADYGLPSTKALSSLALSELKLNKGGIIPSAAEAPLLAHFDQINILINNFIPAFLLRAKEGIKQRFMAQKHQRNLMAPDDLLSNLASALDANPDTLASAIGQRFPVALIDEFQDTDPLQFNIFSQVYGKASSEEQHLEASPKTGLSLLMIGDPKQAIYAFRGADIHTYIQARNQTPAHYNLATNFRSSENLVLGVNRLFAQHKDPFINQAIPFDSVKTPSSAAEKQLIGAQISKAALQIKLLAEDAEFGLNKTQARQHLAADAASEIRQLLTQSQQGECQLSESNKPPRPLKAKDIAVLVRDRNEAAVIKAALNARQIGAVFLSRDSVFDTLEARELLLLLRALANPKDERLLRAGLATELMGYDALQIHSFNQDEDSRQTLLSQFYHWHQLWQRQGVMPALLALANWSGLIPRFLAKGSTKDFLAKGSANDSHNDSHNNSAAPQSTSATEFDTEQDETQPSELASGERRLTDFRHLCELLQQKATELDGSAALINWFEQQLIAANTTDEQQLRLESEQNLVQIVTIHKSKGLEYPVCFVPFVSLARGSNRRPSPILYHKEGQLIWDIHDTDEGLESYQQAHLAEDLRLLYVALTRPVFRCYLYIANQCRQLKGGVSSQLAETGIGYLLGAKDKKVDFSFIQGAVQAITADIPAIEVSLVSDNPDTQVLANNDDNDHHLAPKTLTRGYQTPWRVGSYSGLVKHQAHEKVSPGADDEEFTDELTLHFTEQEAHETVSAHLADKPLAPAPLYEPAPQDELVPLDRFSFERGANAGSFMHLVLENFDFSQYQSQLSDAIRDAMVHYGFDVELWLEPLTTWYQEVVTTPLLLPEQTPRNTQFAASQQQRRFSLSELNPSKIKVEMEFYLPISALGSLALNKLLQSHGYQAQLSFDTLRGMLKGFIDLTFEYQGQFFIADYKSNHLGHSLEDYQMANMAKAMDEHQYHLQYIIYTLALHRYLKLRLPSYDYDTHIGGCFYLFLRGMSPTHLGTGVFFNRPSLDLIKALDSLFSDGESKIEAQVDSQSMPSSETKVAKPLKGSTL
ncbi:UvrD-helicase domain-containing protein [Shewanella sp. SR44-3]|uniref:UvrD-helicase domain-containing protein n=1 Tax=Shewanella sp. SR44-3 TaxID=2760936 RepID=UPI00217573CF|nr:UvrD-helicase domain-containing protein [Shewanella sp. SR44-3]